MGFVYVIEAKEAFKVGIAGNVKRRLGSLQIGSPETLSLRYHWEARDARDVEKKLHDALKAFHKRGEWFDREALGVCEEEIRKMRDAGVLFEPQRANRFPLKSQKDWSAKPPQTAGARPKAVNFEGSVEAALELLWPTGHFPTWDSSCEEIANYLNSPECEPQFRSYRTVSPVRSSRSGTYHYPLLYAALCFLRREAEVDPTSVRDGIVSRGRPPHPEPDSLTAVQHLVHAPAVCKNPAVCPGRYLPPRGGRRKA